MSVYADLGIRPLINAWGTVTAVGGSLMDPDVLDAMREAAASFVDLHVLQRRAGERIAGLLGVEAACVTAGAAAGLTLTAAACMTAQSPERASLLQPTSGLSEECLMLHPHRNRYDRAVTLGGARVVDVGGATTAPGDLHAAVTDRTAMLLYMAESEAVPGSLPLREVCAIMHEHGIPVVVDAAAEIPPRSRLLEYFDGGADLIVVSGGKQIRGPQSSGLILGKEALVARCAAIGYPNHGIGRGMKTDKETIVGLVKAVELFVRRDEAADFARWEAMADALVHRLGASDTLLARRHVPEGPGIQPAGIPRAYVTPLGRTAAEVQTRLREADPAVAVGVDGDDIAINPQCLEPDQVDLVVGAVEEACA